MDFSYILVIFPIAWLITAYNAMVKADTEANDALANLDVFLLKRLTLTTQLIASVKKLLTVSSDNCSKFFPISSIFLKIILLKNQL